ncbi:MAG: hypothetical protein HYV51_03085 [Parcubacteria group bacterium]|nr:hypothetical protein [Parcubacteria group bacterium]
MPEHEKFNQNHTDEWLKISKELENDKNLVGEYEEFLENEIKRGAVKKEIPAKKISAEQDEIEKREVNNEWTLEHLNEIEKSNPDKLPNVFFGFVILKKILATELRQKDEIEKAEDLETSIKELASAYKGKKISGLLIEFMKIFKEYSIPDSLLRIDVLSEMARNFQENLRMQDFEQEDSGNNF